MVFKMKKISIFIIITLMLFITGCESNDESDDVINQVRQECCIDNGGRWSGSVCTFDDYVGTKGYKDNYEECLNYRVSVK